MSEYLEGNHGYGGGPTDSDQEPLVDLREGFGAFCQLPDELRTSEAKVIVNRMRESFGDHAFNKPFARNQNGSIWFKLPSGLLTLRDYAFGNFDSSERAVMANVAIRTTLIGLGQAGWVVHYDSNEQERYREVIPIDILRAVAHGDGVLPEGGCELPNQPYQGSWLEEFWKVIKADDKLRERFKGVPWE